MIYLLTGEPSFESEIILSNGTWIPRKT